MLLKIQKQLFLLAALVMLAIPTVPLFVTPGGLATLFTRPASGISDLKTRATEVANTQFGLAEEISRIARQMRGLGNRDTDQVLHGPEGWLFLNSRKMQNRMEGIHESPAVVARWMDFVARLDAIQSAHGGRLVVAVAPDKASIYPDQAPAGLAQGQASRDSLDSFHELLRNGGFTFVDVRRELRVRREDFPLYDRYDTHWNRLGSLIAYNMIVEALGDAGNAFPPGDYFRGFTTIERVSDLSRMLDPDAVPVKVPWPDFRNGLYDDTGVTKQDLGKDPNLPAFSRYRMTRDDAAPSAGQNPRVLVVGDSFSYNFWGPLFARRYGSMQWVHHAQGRIDLSEVEAIAADLVVLEVVERMLE